MRRTLRTTSTLALLFASACGVTPAASNDVERLLVEAEAMVQKGEHESALATLEHLPDEVCPKRLRDRRDVATASAQMGQGELWDAFLVLEKFADDYPHSELRSTVVEMLWEIGSTLAMSDRGFWIFWSDRRGGRTVLEHLITRHPDTPRLADALRLLGDMAYEDADYELAQERFRDLMRRRPESEWVNYACFRFAMSIVDSLQGPDYDLDKMNHAVRELNDFLANPPENPELVGKAQAALERLRDWRAQRHLSIAAFYRRVDNPAGERLHLEIVAQPEFRGTDAQKTALERLAAFSSTASLPPEAP